MNHLSVKDFSNIKANNYSGDLRDLIFESIFENNYLAQITAREEGVIAGVTRVVEEGIKLGLGITKFVDDGDYILPDTIIFKIKGTPKKLALGEDHLLGILGKYSGIATAARKAKLIANNEIKVVSGGWKKMPCEIKEPLREAIKIGGLPLRISEKPFIYLDKNYVRMFGGIKETLLAVREIERLKVIQVKGDFNTIENEVLDAANNGADIIMVDTGLIKDCQLASEILRKNNLRSSVKLAFGGSIKINDIAGLKKYDIDIIDVGREIVDAPILDFSFDILV